MLTTQEVRTEISGIPEGKGGMAESDGVVSVSFQGWLLPNSAQAAACSPGELSIVSPGL